jgi:hypothetical protein
MTYLHHLPMLVRSPKKIYCRSSGLSRYSPLKTNSHIQIVERSRYTNSHILDINIILSASIRKESGIGERDKINTSFLVPFYCVTEPTFENEQEDRFIYIQKINYKKGTLDISLTVYFIIN